MKLWIARDKDGTLCVFESKPYLKKDKDWDSNYNYEVELKLVCNETRR